MVQSERELTVTEERKNRNRHENKHFKKRPPQIDEKVRQMIHAAEVALFDSMQPYAIPGLNAFQRRQVHLHFKKSQEFEVKSYKETEEDVTLKVFPVGMLKRLAEQKAQEVLMQGEIADLPPMGSFERFVIHDYLKERDGIKTESEGEGKERHIRIMPIFGRNLKKAKKRLIR